jgi:hypothetical protein
VRGPGTQPAKPIATTKRANHTGAQIPKPHARDMLFLFKGTPSTSPYCTWVNDPREPEELPPDWKPDPPALQPLPDDPPV